MNDFNYKLERLCRRLSTSSWHSRSSFLGSRTIAQAVSPAPDGGYPGGNTAEGQNALLSLTSGTYNTALGLVCRSGAILKANFNTAIGAGALFANVDHQTKTRPLVPGRSSAAPSPVRARPMEHSRYLTTLLAPPTPPSGNVSALPLTLQVTSTRPLATARSFILPAAATRPWALVPETTFSRPIT